MTTAEIQTPKPMQPTNGGKRSNSSTTNDYGGWSQDDHMKFIESKFYSL